MQFQFIKFLKKNISENKVKQIFITSHSTHVTSSTPLDDIICLYKENGKSEVAYHGRVFFDIESGDQKKISLIVRNMFRDFLMQLNRICYLQKK